MATRRIRRMPQPVTPGYATLAPHNTPPTPEGVLRRWPH